MALARKQPAIVLPLDGSPTSACAFGAAHALTKLVGGVLHVVHVTEHPLPHHRLARHLHIGPIEERLVFHQVRGEVAGAILELAKDVKAWMVVLSGQGQTSDPRRIVGQTALDLLQRSTFPVTVVRAAMREHPGPDWRPAKMLVPLEGIPLADHVINEIFDLAQTLKADLDILHIAVTRKRPPLAVGALASPRYLDHPRYDWPAWSEEFLLRFYAYLHPDITLHLFHRRGKPDRVILRFAMENDEDLIALSWQGPLREQAAATVRGVLARAEVPVLLIRT